MVRLYNALTSSLLLTTLTTVTHALNIQDTLTKRPELSTFLNILNENPALLDVMNSAGGGPKVTVFAPSNDAINTTDIRTLETGTQQALFRYHILNGSYPASALSVEGGQTLKTLLASDLYARLGQGEPNVVFASKFGSMGVGEPMAKPVIYTGLGVQAALEAVDIEYDAGVIHVVQSVFGLPQNCTKTAETADLNSLVTALDNSHLMKFVDTTPRLTCFAPSDAAFKAAGNPEVSLNATTLADALKYHTLVGEFVGYTDQWKDGMELKTLLEGESMKLTKSGGQWYVNGVKVLTANVIMNNGVAHVLEAVLNPQSKRTPPGDDNTTTPTSTPPTSTPSDDHGGAGVALKIQDTAAILVMALLGAYYLLV